MTPPTSLLVLAKAPVPGRVKTRLTTRYTADQAAWLAEAALADTLDVVTSIPDVVPILILDGTPGSWLPTAMRCEPQVQGAHDARIAAAFDLVRGEAAILIGMDTPQIAADQLHEAVLRMKNGAVLGPARDGGWWALGLPCADGALVRGVPTSTADTGRHQHCRLEEAGLRVHLLPTLIDVDTPDDAADVAALIPGSRFGALWHSLNATESVA